MTFESASSQASLLMLNIYLCRGWKQLRPAGRRPYDQAMGTVGSRRARLVQVTHPAQQLDLTVYRTPTDSALSLNRANYDRSYHLFNHRRGGLRPPGSRF